MSNASFKVGKLDIGTFNESSEKPRASDGKPRFINKPGMYNLVVETYTLQADDRQKDGAGKQWGRLTIKAKDAATGYGVTGFVDVPLETLVYTSKSGTTSNVKTRIFQDFVQALTGNRPAPQGIAAAVNGLSDILVGSTFTAKVGYDRDYVSYEGKNDEGEPILGLRLKNGDAMLSIDGEPLTFSSRDSAVEYYTKLKGFKPSTGVLILSYPNKKDA